METQEGILQLLKEKTAESLERSRRAVILQPGAIGDCILTLPLADFIKKKLKAGAVDIIARADYAGYLPGRTCIDSIRTLDSVNLHRLFLSSTRFELADGDALIDVFTGYSFIISFLGEENSDFEQNLIFTANCGSSCEVVLLKQIPDSPETGHISIYHIKNFVRSCNIDNATDSHPPNRKWINASPFDVAAGRNILKNRGIDNNARLTIIHPGSGDLKKCWHLNNFIALANHLRNEDWQVVFLLGPAEIERFTNDQIAAVNNTAVTLTQLSLLEVLQILACADCFIGNDSGITHLGAGLGIKTVALFGPTNSQIYGPLGPDVNVIEDNTETFASSPSDAIQQKVLQVVGG